MNKISNETKTKYGCRKVINNALAVSMILLIPTIAVAEEFIFIPLALNNNVVDEQITTPGRVIEQSSTTQHFQEKTYQIDNVTATKNDIKGAFLVTAYSPVQPIQEFLNDWKAPVDSGDIAYAQARANIDFQRSSSPFGYGLGWRYDYLLSFNEATSEVYWRYKNKSNPNQNKQYPLLLEASHNERIGANISYDFPVNPSLNIRTKANVWYGLHAVQGRIDGQLTTNATSFDSDSFKLLDSIANLDANIDYYYDKPALHEERLGWHPDAPNGYGYSLDIHIDGKVGDNTSFKVGGYDLLGRMHWKDMPSTRYNLDYDIARRPLYNLEGQLNEQDETQTLPWRVEGDIVHTLSSPSVKQDNWQVGIHGQANDIKRLYQLSAGYQFDYRQTPIVVTGLVEPQTNSLGLMIQSDIVGVKVLTDDMNFDDAKRTEVGVYGHYQW